MKRIKTGPSLIQSVKSKLSRSVPGKIQESLSRLPFEKESSHEKKVNQYFDAFKMPADIKPLKNPVCIMLFTNRSGSSLIGEHMRATGRFKGFGEPLNHKLILKLSERENLTSFAEYLQWQFSRHATGDTVIGMKASERQAMMLYRSGAIPHLFSDVRWVLLQRTDILSQAISYSIAAQTKQWTSGKKGIQSEADYAFDKILKRVKALTDSYASMNTFCSMFGIQPYRITYEEFAADPKLGAANLAAYLGVNEVEFDDSRLKMRKQRNHLNQEFKERFLEDYGKRLVARF